MADRICAKIYNNGDKPWELQPTCSRPIIFVVTCGALQVNSLSRLLEEKLTCHAPHKHLLNETGRKLEEGVSKPVQPICEVTANASPEISHVFSSPMSEGRPAEGSFAGIRKLSNSVSTNLTEDSLTAFQRVGRHLFGRPLNAIISPSRSSSVPIWTGRQSANQSDHPFLRCPPWQIPLLVIRFAIVPLVPAWLLSCLIISLGSWIYATATHGQILPQDRVFGTIPSTSENDMITRWPLYSDTPTDTSPRETQTSTRRRLPILN
eukprot:GHVT01064849.1.p1 GENE.GHVT01064849.1~~GHVT01064849.1.p1  ORF type:complete len:264 (-),score=1.08 GHVT01064849.1:744-1535(-)